MYTQWPYTVHIDTTTALAVTPQHPPLLTFQPVASSTFSQIIYNNNTKKNIDAVNLFIMVTVVCVTLPLQ